MTFPVNNWAFAGVSDAAFRVAANAEYQIGDTVKRFVGQPLPPAPAGTQWVEVDRSETYPESVEYQLRSSAAQSSKDASQDFGDRYVAFFNGARPITAYQVVDYIEDFNTTFPAGSPDRGRWVSATHKAFLKVGSLAFTKTGANRMRQFLISNGINGS